MKQYSDITALIKEKIGTMIFVGFLLAAASFLFLLINEKNFSSSTDYLVVQNSTNTTDTYALAKSAEYTGKIISEGVYSELFINEVVKTGKINSEFLPFDKKNKLKNWSKMVGVNQRANLGIINVTVFDNNQKQALAVSQAISEVLTMNSKLFLGEGQMIEVRILSGPVLQNNPSIANIIFATFGGFIFGAFIALVRIFYKANNLTVKTYSSAPVFENVGFSTKERMNDSGIFAQDDNYLESLRNMEK